MLRGGAARPVHRVVYAQLVAGQRRAEIYGERIVNEDDFKHGHVNTRCTRSSTKWRPRILRKTRHGRSHDPPGQRDRAGQESSARSITSSASLTRRAASRSSSPQGHDAAPIHVDEIAEIFADRVIEGQAGPCDLQNRRHTISLGELATWCANSADAQISFDNETGRRERSGNFMIDQQPGGLTEFGMQFRPYRERGVADHQRSPRRRGQGADHRPLS